MTDDLSRLLVSTKSWTDIVLACRGRQFPCHRVVLAARSNVFASMFLHQDTTEEVHNQVRYFASVCGGGGGRGVAAIVPLHLKVDIDDTDPEVLEEFVRFLYRDCLSAFASGDSEADLVSDSGSGGGSSNSSSSSNAVWMLTGLLSLADKYNVPRLKELAEQHLTQRLCMRQLAVILTYAKLHNAEILSAEAVKFMGARKEEVLDTAGWKEMLEVQPRMAEEILKELSKEDGENQGPDSTTARRLWSTLGFQRWLTALRAIF